MRSEANGLEVKPSRLALLPDVTHQVSRDLKNGVGVGALINTSQRMPNGRARSVMEPASPSADGVVWAMALSSTTKRTGTDQKLAMFRLS